LKLLPSVPPSVLFSQNRRCIVTGHNNETTERKFLDAAFRKPTDIVCAVNMRNKVASHRIKHTSVSQHIFVFSVLPLFICSVLCPEGLFFLSLSVSLRVDHCWQCHGGTGVASVLLYGCLHRWLNYLRRYIHKYR